MISNVFLHYVLDLWFEQDVKPRLRGSAFLIRYADDFVIGFRDHRDAQRVMEVIPKRFGKYGLTVHSTKTKLVPFRPPSSRTKDDDGPDCPGTFDLLGFTHYWAKSLKGYWVVKLKTASDRFTRAVRSIDRWCHDNRHLPLAEQQQTLNQKLPPEEELDLEKQSFHLDIDTDQYHAHAYCMTQSFLSESLDWAMDAGKETCVLITDVEEFGELVHEVAVDYGLTDWTFSH